MHRLPAVVAMAALGAAISSCSNQSPAPGGDLASTAAELSTKAPTLTPQVSGTTNGLIAVSPVNASVVWASGRKGTFVVTTDGGATWKPGVVAGAESLQFRDVEGVSANVAYLLSIGNGTDSRIYKTEDGGKTWTLQFTNQDPNAFYDAFAFWTPRRGIAFSDSTNGRFPVQRTTDGKTWVDIGNNLPHPLAGESGFASSGTCVATQGEKRAWIGTGGAAQARILATKDGGDSWAAYNTPLRGSPSAGIFTVAFRDASHGIIGGGDLDPKALPFDNVARSANGGKSWQVAARADVGTIFGLAYARDRNEDDDGGEGESSARAGASRATVVVTGPAGTAWSANEGDNWTTFTGVTGFWAVAFADERTGWLVGTGGRILKITFPGD